MDSLIQALGLDWRIFLAQFINFAILIFVLWRFAYRPLFALLEKRRKKIEQGIKDSKEANVRLDKSIEESRKIISKARQDASKIIEEAQEKAEKRYQEIVEKAKGEIKIVMDKEKEKIMQEKNQIVSQVKSEFSDLLILSLEKFLGEHLDAEKDQKIITKIVKDLS